MMPLPFRTDALRSYRLFESDDLDETREQISRVMQPHALKPAGSRIGRSYMDFVRLGGIGLGTIVFGDAMRVNVEAVDDYYLMMFCLAGHAEVRTAKGTFRVDQDNGVLCAPGHPFDAALSRDCEQFVLRIDRPILGAHVTSRTSRFTPHVHVGSAPLRAWMQYLQLIAASSELIEVAQSNPRISSHLERLLLELLASGYPADPSAASRPGISPGSVKRAVDFIVAQSAEPLRVLDIANAVGVPERTLRTVFQQFQGMTPMQFLHEVRLERAREALRRGSADARVADIALDCGFTHLGRFSLAYKAKFGESPSDTLKYRNRFLR